MYTVLLRTSNALPALRLVVACTLAAAPAVAQETSTSEAPATQGEIAKVLASGSLKSQPNPVVLEFLDVLGSERLTPEQLERARKQTVEGLLGRTEVSQMAAMGAMVGAMPGMMKKAIKEQFKPKNLLRSRLGVAGNNAAMQNAMMEDFSSAMVAPWVRGLAAARALRDAGYEREAAAFYRRCLAEPTMATGADQQLSASAQRVRGGCLDDLVALGPQIAAPILGDLADTEAADEAQAGTAAAAQAAGFSGLAALIEAGAFDATQRAAVVDAALYVVQQPKRRLIDHSAAAAIQVLAVANEPSTEAILVELADSEKKLPLAADAARTALALGHDDPAWMDWLIGTLADDDSGDDWSTFELLMKENHQAAWSWAERQVGRMSVPQNETDWRPALLELFAGAADQRSLDILVSVDNPAAEPGDYIQALIDIALFQRGDRDRIDALAAALDQAEWDLGRSSLGRKWQIVKPLARTVAASAIGLPVAATGRESNQEMMADMAFGAADFKAENESVEESATRQLRFRIAAALAGWNDAAALPLIQSLLDSEDEPTRIAGARALLGQTTSGTVPLLVHGIQLQYDPVETEEPPSDPRTPEIVAALMMHADFVAASDPGIQAAVGDIDRFESPSLRFLAAGLVEPSPG